MEAIDIRQQPDDRDQRPPQRGCLAVGCTCKDVRIVSRRRAKFHAYLADVRGETAARVINPDLDWVLPFSA
jgi:hypothetical protein